MTAEGYRLDPSDWGAFRHRFHALLGTCIDRMQAARELPWIEKPADIAAKVALRDVRQGQNVGAVFDRMIADIMPYATGNTHPRFFGWVHGTGLPIAAAAELVAVVMNSNMGGRDHGGVEVERAVIDWMCRLAGLPDTAFGTLTTGTSQATILALSTARTRLLGDDIRRKGIAAFPNIGIYIAEGGHACVAKALEVLGHGSDSLRKIALTPNGQMDLSALADAVVRDRTAGLLPLAVVGTAGSVNTGAYDPLDALADYCAAQGIWLHIDAAFGFWSMLADDPWRGLTQGIGCVDSIATDFHKWMAVPMTAARV